MKKTKSKIRKIIAIGKRDAFYGVRKSLIGLIGKIDYEENGSGGFISCWFTDMEGKHRYFYRVKLSICDEKDIPG